MAKERKFQIKRKQRMKVTFIMVLLLTVFGAIFFINQDNKLSENIFEKFNATGTLNTPQTLIGFVKNDGSNQFFSFVDFSVDDAPQSFEKTSDAPFIYEKPKNINWKIGSTCDVGEAIVFKECSNPNDRSSCARNLFDEIWQVNSRGDYPNAQDFYIDDMELYFTYSCYDPRQSFADNFERKYLYNGQCVSESDSRGRGEEYRTEKFCLEALEEQREEQKEEEERRQEKARLDNLEDQCEDNGGRFDRSRERCYATQDDEEEEEEQDNSRDNTQEDTTNEEESNFDSGEDSSTNEQETTNEDNTQQDTSQNTQDKSSDTLTCKAYESKEEGDCNFSITKLFTDKGLSQYWQDKPLNIVGGVFLLIVVVGLVIPNIRRRITGGNK